MATSIEKYKKIFLAEAEEKIAVLNTAFLGLEKEPGNSALANDAMRAAHTLKSSAAAMGFVNISHLCHAMEDVFSTIGGKARTKGQALAPRIIEILFNCVDTLSAALAAIKKGKPEPSTAALIKKLAQISAKGGENLKSEILNHKSVEGIVLAQKPESIAPIEAIKVDVATLDKLMNLTEELLVEKMRLSELVRQAKAPTLARGEVGVPTAERVGKKLNEELYLAELGSSSEAFNRLIPELQLNVTEARMVPLGQIFERFPRMVRDLAHEQNKEVDFDIVGQDIELDRTIIDKLGEPLIHLLRNAVDHGIDKIGKIHLTALQERDKVIIEVTNEGRPIDWQRVVEVAIARNIISKERGSVLSRNYAESNAEQRRNLPRDSASSSASFSDELEALLYKVSTKDKVTETSGRGVGLSIVKSVIESLGGTVRLESNAGETKFILSLPLTLAIIQALLVRVVNQTFALPFVQIDRSVRVSRQNIKKAFDQEIAVVEDEDIPMMRLDKLFGIERKRMGLFLSDEEVEKRKTAQQAELMVITKRENLVGIMIDELLSTQDIVVKPFKGMLRQTKGFAGITLLGDGKPAMILDVPTLLERLKISNLKLQIDQ